MKSLRNRPPRLRAKPAAGPEAPSKKAARNASEKNCSAAGSEARTGFFFFFLARSLYFDGGKKKKLPYVVPFFKCSKEYFSAST